MRFISEMVSDYINPTINEAENSPSVYMIEGTFINVDMVNRNKRIYPMNVVDPVVEKYRIERINKNRAVGELDHPPKPDINTDRISHNIVSLLKVDEHTFEGKAKILNTPMGQIVKTLMDENITFGVSTRGLASLRNENGIDVVQDDFKLIAIDIVSDPSAPNAFVNGIMENKEWVYVDGILVEQDIDNIQKRINKASKKKRTNQEVLNIFNNILNSI